ncbi:peptide ABC transporter [Paenibacillus polymyxa]|nr:peptide ABC transporter [Paenibacillus polymyxa]
MKKIIRILWIMMPLLSVLVIPVQVMAQAELSSTQISRIETFVQEKMNQGNIPGASVVITEGDRTLYKKGFGYSDVSASQSVTPETLFELGSNSKAFTALAILQMEKEGLIHGTDPIDRYIPWLKMKYKGTEQKVSIEQLLHHISGIPFKTIADIPPGETEDMLEQTVKTLVGIELDAPPGDKFSYATINYDVLGYLIQTVSGQPFEEYMQEHILNPLGLTEIYLSREEAALNDFSKGYKISFLKARPYEAPMYRGNTPAGYFIANANAMETWLKIHTGAASSTEFDRDLIRKSHEPDMNATVNESGETYASGWYVNENKKEVSHGGNNPNYSSYMLLNQQKQMGIAVLANMNSSYTADIANGIAELLNGSEIMSSSGDTYQSLDKTATAIMLMTFLGMLGSIISISFVILQLRSGKRKYNRIGLKEFVTLLLSLLALGVIGYYLYEAPKTFFNGVTWSFVQVWAPSSLLAAVWGVVIFGVLMYINLILTQLFKKHDAKPYLSIILFSILSGLGNSFIIFMINESLGRGAGFQFQFFIFFVLGIAIYIIGLKISSTKLVKLTNDLVYSLRTKLLNKILNSPYEEIEKMDKGKIHAAMNNDTEVISNVANFVTQAVASFVTLICCFIYLGVINIYGLLLSLGIILFIASLYFLAGRSAGNLMEASRDVQNVFLKFINDLDSGFKELRLNSKKRKEFQLDMDQTSAIYREKKKQAALKFINVNVMGELLFTLALGSVAFMFPIVFKEFQSGNLRSYVFVLLYMTGPIHGILNVIPNIVQVNVSWKRVNAILKQIPASDSDQHVKRIAVNTSSLALELKDVAYAYPTTNQDHFAVGPINYTFRAGEITFITGGNGSGKSTLAKLITGLYCPTGGSIQLQGKEIVPESLGEYFSTIFSDFYIFDKLYGIDSGEKEAEIHTYLKLLKIEDKLHIHNKAFSTTKLSTGQRKRLALMISYIEDKPFCLFDEWAADQDPEFRHFFYMDLLPELKRRGKMIIAITHDDRYFNVADHIIKMELGQLIQQRDLMEVPK